MNQIEQPIAIGINARLFPINWRPATEEIAFAQRLGCACIQIHGREGGIDATYLGASPQAIGEILARHAMRAVMEIVVRLLPDGRTQSGATPLDVLSANLPAIDALAIRHVHWHFAPAVLLSRDELRALEDMLIDHLRAGVNLARTHGFTLALEHNEPDVPLFADIGSITTALEAVPDLGFVWDLNHTPPDELEIGRASCRERV